MNTIFADLPDVLDAKTLAQALSISKSSAYALMNLKDFPHTSARRAETGDQAGSHCMDEQAYPRRRRSE